MPRSLLSSVLAASAVAGSGGYELIGDVMDKNSRLRSQQRDRSLDGNVDILQSMLGKEHFDIERDECLDGVDPVTGAAVYGRCDIRRFPYCHGDRPNMCFNRVNRQDAFWPDRHPRYYIDYNRVHCYPDKIRNVHFTCSSCSPGRWCMPEGRCILDETMYHCWADDAGTGRARG